jgi:hypothetical protein
MIVAAPDATVSREPGGRSRGFRAKGFMSPAAHGVGRDLTVGASWL